MDLRAALGLVLIVAGLVLAAIALFGNSAAVSRFLSLPKRGADWLRVLLAALAASAIGIQLVSRFGYSLPLLRTLPADSASLYLASALALLSLCALWVDRHAGALYGAISLSLIAFLVLPGPA